MRVLVISNLYDISYDELDTSLIEKKDDYDIIVLLGNIDINTLKYIKYTLSHNNIYKDIIGIEGNDDIEGVLESLEIKNIHMKCKSLHGKKFAGFSGSIKSNEPSTHPTYTQSQAYELLDTLDKCDVLISHNSPKGYEESFMQTGFVALNEYIDTNNPCLCIHGHKHNNSISLYCDTYIIGISGIAIIDVDKFTIIKLY